MVAFSVQHKFKFVVARVNVRFFSNIKDCLLMQNIQIYSEYIIDENSSTIVLRKGHELKVTQHSAEEKKAMR